MLILVLIDVQYSQKAVFSFEKGSNCQNHFSAGAFHPVKKISPSVKFPIPPPPTSYRYLKNPGACDRKSCELRVKIGKCRRRSWNCGRREWSIVIVKKHVCNVKNNLGKLYFLDPMSWILHHFLHDSQWNGTLVIYFRK